MTELLKSPLTLAGLHARRDEILELAAKHGATTVRVFGSVARGEAHPESDIDFLVDFAKGTSIWHVIGLWQDLSELLGREVNVVTEDMLDGSFKQNVLRDAIPLDEVGLCPKSAQT